MTKPTPPLLSGGLPLLGHALEYKRDRSSLVKRGYAEHGPVFGIKLANQNAAVVAGPELQKTFFMETDKKLNMDKPYQFLTAIFGEVAFLASPETYQEQRHILHSPFKREKMLKYLDIMQTQVQAWVDSLGPEGEMDLTKEMVRVVQNVAGYALMGEEFQKSVGREFWDLYGDLGKALDPLLPPHWPLPKFRRRDRAKARMIEILQPVIDERRANPEKYDDFLQDFVNTPYKDGREVDDETLTSLVLAINFAGHETTAGQAAWAIILLLQTPDYLKLVQAEISELLPYGTIIDTNVLNSLQHIIWAVRETERMRTSADLVMRYVKEDIEFGDYVVPAGWLVQTSATIAHFLPEVFAEPERYDPLRYAPDRAEDKQPRFALIGFGGGLHKCAGMNFANNEMAIITALLFQQLELELVTPDPEMDFGLGAARPGKTIVRYRRKFPAIQPVPDAVMSPVSV